MLFLFFKNYINLILVNGIRRDNTADTGGGINAGATANNSAGVEDAVAAHFNLITKDSANLPPSGFYITIRILHADIGLITLDIAGD